MEGGILTIDHAAAYLSIPKARPYTWRTRRVGFGPPAVTFRWRATAKQSLVAVGLTVLLLTGLPVPAWAHGDPASHYLEHELLYPAIASRPTAGTELRLLSALSASRDGGFPLRVALVANASDLTEDHTMLTRPQAYAEYVTAEIGGLSAASGPVLVITPSGYGLAGTYRPADGAPHALTRSDSRDLLSRLPAPGADGEHLARAGLAATRELARKSGHPLPEVVPTVEGLVSSSETRVADLPHPGWWLPLGVFAFVMLFAVTVYELQRWSNRRDAPAPCP